VPYSIGMPRSCLGLRWFHILATGAITVGLSSGCELVVGELPQAVDSVALTDAGGRGAGGVATSHTAGASGNGASSGSTASGGDGGSAPGGSGAGGPADGGASW
jgi:hypothetical protein